MAGLTELTSECGFSISNNRGVISQEQVDPPAGKCIEAERNLLIQAGGYGPKIPAPYDQADKVGLYYEPFQFAKRVQVTITNTSSRSRTNATVRVSLQWHSVASATYIPYKELNSGGDFYWTATDGITPVSFVRTDYDGGADTVEFILGLDEFLAGHSYVLFLYMNHVTINTGTGNWRDVFRPGNEPQQRELVTRAHISLVTCRDERGGEDLVTWLSSTRYPSMDHVLEQRCYFGSSANVGWVSSGDGPPHAGDGSWVLAYNAGEPHWYISSVSTYIQLALRGDNTPNEADGPGRIRFWFKPVSFAWGTNTKKYLLMYCRMTSGVYGDIDFSGLRVFLYKDDGSGAVGSAGFYIGFDYWGFGSLQSTYMKLSTTDPFTTSAWTSISFSYLNESYNNMQLNVAVRWGQALPRKWPVIR